jgi:hypothetical protein
MGCLGERKYKSSLKSSRLCATVKSTPISCLHFSSSNGRGQTLPQNADSVEASERRLQAAAAWSGPLLPPEGGVPGKPGFNAHDDAICKFRHFHGSRSSR